jgi:predicted nucleic acid-binding protein
MSDKVFIDTNVFIYAHDRSEPVKRDRARKLLFDAYRSDRAIISAQVLAEFFHVFAVKFGFPYADTLKELHFMSRCPVVEQSVGLVVSAASLFSRYSLSFWDAMIVAAAVEASAGVLYSEDMQHGLDVEGVRVVNPFSHSGAKNC